VEAVDVFEKFLIISNE